MSPYFDPDYFSPDYFDTGGTTTEAPQGGYFRPHRFIPEKEREDALEALLLADE